MSGNVPRLRFTREDGSSFPIWKEILLGSIFSSIKSGKDKPNSKSGYCVYGSRGVVGYSDTFSFKEKNILIARVGANAGSLNIAEGSYGVTDNTLILENGKLDLNFLYPALLQMNLQRLVFGSGQPLITGGQLKNLKIQIPVPEEQQKIASFLTAVDGKINLLQQKLEHLQTYKRGVMQKLFSQEIRFTREDGSSFPDWEEKKLGEIINLMQSGLSRMLSDQDIGLPVIRSNNIQNSVLKIEDIKYCHRKDTQGANTASYFLEDNDLLVSFINSISQIGKVALYKNLLGRNVIFTTNIMRIKFNKHSDVKFIYYFFNTHFYFKYIHSITKPAVNQASFTKKDFERLRVWLPSLEEQQKIASFLSEIDKKIEILNQKITHVEEFKKGLLQQMFV